MTDAAAAAAVPELVEAAGPGLINFPHEREGNRPLFMAAASNSTKVRVLLVLWC